MPAKADDSGLPKSCHAGLPEGHDESDESVVAKWVENVYWQYFCGFEYMQHDFPIHPTSMTKWRQRAGKGLTTVEDGSGIDLHLYIGNAGFYRLLRFWTLPIDFSALC